MATYFLADIHLAENRPEITAAFLATLAAIARDAEAIYILGDLYDYWLGDDLATPYQQRIAAALAARTAPAHCRKTARTKPGAHPPQKHAHHRHQPRRHPRRPAKCPREHPHPRPHPPPCRASPG